MAAIPVRVEPPGENPVLEVSYDGQEVTQPPLSMSEHLAKMARKVDFTSDQQASPEQEEMDTEVGENIKSFQQPGTYGYSIG